jgi:tetratricopeptide (TPR) repeat protein
MKYLPDLIPKDIKVLPDYFKGNIYASSTKNKSASILFYIGAAIFFIAAIANVKHPLLTLLFGLIGFILLPQGHRWLERQFRFRFTPKIKSVFGAALFVTAVPFVGQYQKVDKQETYELKVKTEKEAADKLNADKKEQQRKDSLNFYLQSAAALEKSSKNDEALSKINYASNFSPTETEKTEITNSKNHVLATKTFALVKQGKYQAAIPELSNFLSSDPSNSELLYNRAVCYSKTGKIQEAVTDLKPLLQSGNEEAHKLHEKINPLRKRVSYYVTRFWDGSTSSSKGSGACSRHGGVKNWNETVYEEYRKYE